MPSSQAAHRLALLSTDAMAKADSATIAAGTAGLVLMENAGQAVARETQLRWQPRPVLVLCGPGNNGGDGFAVARLLSEAGWPARVALLGSRDKLKGDAAAMAARWNDAVLPLTVDALEGAELVVDALFGAGLARDLEGPVRAVVEAVNTRELPCAAVDIPSGIHGDTGAVMGAAMRADLTVTFCRRKPGHLLLPGRLMAGQVVVADIGIPDAVVEALDVRLHENAPALWEAQFPWPALTDHKYSRGHALVVGGGAAATGAARLAARGALRVGAGLVTVAGPAEALPVYGAQLTAVMVTPLEAFGQLLADPRKNAVLVGPGCGVGEATRRNTLAALAAGKACVLDADALTSFESTPNQLFESISSNVILTPHEGEYCRLFDHVGDKLARARQAARTSGAVVLLKGGDTVVAAPDGRAVINANAPAELATAGAGDVLGGLALGLLAQGMAAFEAASAAAWLHGAAASAFGPGLIAEDIAEALPPILRALKGRSDIHRP
jgi:NAD(P)H-hydrate epimerase